MEDRVGFGVHKLDPKPDASREERLQRSKQMLARVLNLRTTIAFIGSGCSAPLGYPTWKELTARVVKRTQDEVKNLSALEPAAGKLGRFRKQLRTQDGIKADQLLFMLGVCQRVFEQKYGDGGRSVYRKFVSALFAKPSKSAQDPHRNPYHALMDLPISRFVTSNYDCEIEQALQTKRNIREEYLGLGNAEAVCSLDKLRTFTQQPKHFDQLALFILSRVEDAENMVFHCHGNHRDPDSMVITEADYQSWYFRDDDAGVAFRQTLNLLFGSNPILFIGFSLADDDLMRPLRMFAAESLNRKSSRPLFALIPEKPKLTEGQQSLNEDYYSQLYDRYGVHVIPYDLFDPKKPSVGGRTLFDELSELEKLRLELRDAWLKKPFIRRVEIKEKPPKPYQHYPFVHNDAWDFKGKRTENLLVELGKEVKQGARLIGLIGPGGTGKSWFAHQLMKSFQKRKGTGFSGYFFWSSYYSNDALTGLDRALAYLDPDHQHEGDRIERFRKCLRSGRYLLVFDGIERFLRETENPIEGKGFLILAERLLDAMVDDKSKSTVVITSRLWPTAFGPFGQKEGAVCSHLTHRYRSEDIAGSEPFAWIKRPDQHHVSALVSLLDGHIHALVLAAGMLRQAGKMDALSQLKMIERNLSGTPPDRRGERIIRIAIDSLNAQYQGLALTLLERLSCFMAPVGDSTVKICFEEASKGISNLTVRQNDLVNALASSRLIHETIATRSRILPAYTVHPIVREYIFHQIHRAPVGSLPNFSLPGFTAATSALHPGNKEAVNMMEALFNRLCEQAKEKEEDDARGLCRSAFSLIRSRMEALTVPRWGSYDDYLKLLISISHLSKKLAGELWSYVERGSIHNVEGSHGPLYADELAWLYNELGLACYGEGAMPDTLAVWEQGLEINRVIDSHEQGGSYLFQSQCNLGAAYIHYGRLDDAEKYLREAERTNFRLDDKDHAGRILGYLALVKHLRGNLPQAEEMYDQALDALDEQGGNPRAKSIFLRHKCDLKIKLEDFAEAKKCIEMSRGLAEEGSFPELAAAARMSLGHWYRARRKYTEALREYNAALSTAKRIRMRRLECEVISEFARLALDLGDSHIARQRAVESLRIANELVLGLKQTHDLVVLGCATIEARQHKLGIAYLKHAKRLADRQGYWLRSREAEEHLHRLGEAAPEPSQAS